MNSTNLTTRLQELEALKAKILPYKWEYDPRATFVLGRAEGKYTRIAEVLGWGHLTCGRALNFSAAEAEEIQNATGEFIAQAPSAVALARELYDFLKQAGEALESIYTVGLNNVCSGYSSEHVRDHNIKMADHTLTNLKAKGIL